MRQIEIGTQEWGVGILCTVMGAMMLVAPHQFSSPAYAALQPHLLLWGVGFIVAGGNLLAVAALRLREHTATIGHLLAGAGLVILATGFVPGGSPTDLLNFGATGLGAVIAPLVMRAGKGNRGRGEGDFLPLAAGVGAALTGLTMLAFPGMYSAPVNDSLRPHLPWLGAAFLGSGILISFVQLRSSTPWPIRVAAHLFTGATFIVFTLVSSLPMRAWLGVAYYGGFGATIAAQPWLSPRLRAIDPASLRTRVTLVLACATTLPLLALVTLYGAREEDAAVSSGLDQNRTLALALADNVRDYVGLHRAAAAALAAQPGLLDVPPGGQRALLGSLIRVYPEVHAFLTFDARGNPIARSDDLPLVDTSGFPAFDEVRRTGRPSLGLSISPAILRPVLALGEPIRDSTGKLAGVAGVTLEPFRLADLIGRPGTGGDNRAYITDGRGRVIAHPDNSVVVARADLSPSPPLALALAVDRPSGSLEYTSPAGAQLAAYARVPELGWLVVVESPRAASLSASMDRRDLALVLLLAAAALAVAVGAIGASLLAAPLRTLAEAVEMLSSGDVAAPLPSSSISEAARLAASFGTMRESLTVRTRERERLMKEIEGQRRLLQTVVGSAPAGIAVLRGPEFVFEMANPVYQAIAPGKVLLGRSVAETWPELAGQVVPLLERVLRTGEPFHAIDLPLPVQRAASGPIEQVYFTFSYLLMSRGLEEEDRILVLVLETTEQVLARKRVEELAKATEESLAQLEAVVDNMTEGLIISDLDGNVLTMNREMQRLRSHANLEDAPTRMPEGPDILELRYLNGRLMLAEERPLARVLRGETITDLELRVRHIRTGWEGFWSYSGRLVHNRAGEAILAVLTIRDVAARKEAEEELRHRAEEVETLMDLVPAAIWVSRDPGCHQITGNRAANRFYEAMEGENVSAGPEPGATVGPRRFFREGRELRADELPMQEAAAKNVEVHGTEFDVLLPSGQWRTLWGSATPLRNAGGQVRGCVAAFMDITERLQLEQQLRELNAELEERVHRRTADLEASNGELEAFSYSVSHDLRAPLRAIDGFSRILAQEYALQLPAEARRYLDLVRDNAQQMGQLIDDLLSFSRLSRQALSKRLVLPAELARQSLSDLEPERQGRDVRVTIEDLCPCQADPSLLKHVYMNLLSNALKYTRGKPTAIIDVGCRQQEGEVVYFVRDNGVGFDMRYAQKLFGVFQRLHRVEDYEGTGVGLAIVQRVIHRHGGRVWGEGVMDKGATFYFTLAGGDGDN